LAIAGFSPNEVSATAEQNVVIIEGSKPEKAEREFLYRGISTRQFKRQFSLADYVQVKGATFDNGLLKIELVREIPEAMKPRRITINGTSPSDDIHQIEAKAA
jgi:molecular chaperone IbpA